MYKDEVLDHFQDPRNYGEMENPDGVGKVGNVICGDVMWLYIKVAENEQGQEVIKDIKFKTFGCAAAIATSSMVTELAKEKTIMQALDIDKDEVNQSLGELPPVKVHCSLLAADALAEAVYDYLAKQERDIPEKLEKKHQRIQREKEVIEEKYQDWDKGGEE
jgi:nitrogen fixation NifU-like protein